MTWLEPEDDDLWYEECPACAGKGMINDMICAQCEARGHIHHEHDNEEYER